MSQEEVAFHLGAAAPKDLAARLERGTRCGSLWFDAPELWAEAHGRPDLTALIVASRRRVLEVERLGSGLTDHLNHDDPAVLPPRSGLPRVELWHAEEPRLRGEPWLELEIDRACEELGRVAEVGATDRPRFVDERRAALEAVRRLLTKALDGVTSSAGAPSPLHLARVAAMVVPDVSLADVRDIVFPDSFSSAEWAACVAELAEVERTSRAPWGAMWLVPTDEKPWLTKAHERASVRWRETHGTFDALLQKEAATRIVWHPEIRALAAEVIGRRLSRARGVERTRLSRCMSRVHDALRKRYRQTLDGKAHRASLVVRLLAAAYPRESDRRIERRSRAAARCGGALRAMRVQVDPAAEAQFHRWLEPHLRYLPAKLQGKLSLYRAEYVLITTVVTFSTLASRKRWGEERLQDLVRFSLKRLRANAAFMRRCRARLAKRKRSMALGELGENLAQLELINRWFLDRIRERGGRGAPPRGDESILEIARILSPPGDAGWLPSTILAVLHDDHASVWEALEAVKQRRKEPLRARRIDPFGCMLAAQAALLDATKDPWRRVECPWRRGHRDPGDRRTLADELLKEALRGLERPLRRRSYMIARLLLTFDLRLAIGLGPDMTFFAPIRDFIEEQGGRSARATLRELLGDVAHRELLGRELTKEEQHGWREVTHLVDMTHLLDLARSRHP